MAHYFSQKALHIATRLGFEDFKASRVGLMIWSSHAVLYVELYKESGKVWALQLWRNGEWKSYWKLFSI